VTSRPQFTQVPCGVDGSVDLGAGVGMSAGEVTVVMASEAKSSCACCPTTAGLTARP